MSNQLRGRAAHIARRSWHSKWIGIPRESSPTVLYFKGEQVADVNKIAQRFIKFAQAKFAEFVLPFYPLWKLHFMPDFRPYRLVLCKRSANLL